MSHFVEKNIYILHIPAFHRDAEMSLNRGRYFNDLTNSVLAFVREVQEIAEKIEGKQGSLSKGTCQETIRMRRLKQS